MWMGWAWSVAEDVPVDVDEEEEAAEQDGSDHGTLQPSKVYPTSDGQASQIGVAPTIMESR